MISIAIDGPGGAGKSSLAKRLAGQLGYIYVDTGALYRAVGLAALRAAVPTRDEAAVAGLLPGVALQLCYRQGSQVVLLNGEDVSEEIRTPAASMAASDVATLPIVRGFLLETQRRMARTENVIMDGRDIGTTVLPDATLKIFLTAPAEVRARRRLLEMQEKGQQADLVSVLADIRKRDWQDSHREISPLRQAEDAVLVDTGTLSFEEAFQVLLQLIQQKTADR